jgi:hypothetical protein
MPFCLVRPPSMHTKPSVSLPSIATELTSDSSATHVLCAGPAGIASKVGPQSIGFSHKGRVR